MSKSKEKAEDKGLIQCIDCDSCIPIGEGDHICEQSDLLIIENYIPTDDYMECEAEE